MQQTSRNYAHRNCLSTLLFLWLESFIFRGCMRKVRLEDIPNPPSDMEVGRLRENFEKKWRSQRNPSLLRTIISLNMSDIMISGLCVVITNLCDLCALMMGWLILEIIINPDLRDASIATKGIIYCCIYTAISCIGAITNGIYAYICHLMDIKTFTQCTIAMFQKALTLPQDVLYEISTGRILNMIANDLRSIENKGYKMQYIWGFPLTFVGSVLLLYYLVGPIALVGLLVIFSNIVPVFAVAPLIEKLKTKNLAFSDKRVKFINQVIKNIRVVKMFVWEKLTLSYVKRIRRKEWMYGMLYALLGSETFILFFLVSTPLAVYATFIVSYFTNSPIDFGKAVLCFMLYQYVQIITSEFLLFISGCIEVYVSAKRVTHFLKIEVDNKKNYTNASYLYRCCIDIDYLSVEWSNQSKGLECITLRVRNEPHLIFVTGAVGAGKTTLLLTLCNEISLYTGSVQVNGRVAYCAQESWVFSGTIRDNILVGNELEYYRYWKVLAACGLIPDLELFVERDLTLVGERGITLSGGQKARVTLARTVYTKADIYLLDDPLAAVDARVSKHIFEECIQCFLGDTVVILATHQTSFARNNDRMIRLENGRIVSDDKCETNKRNVKDLDPQAFKMYEDICDEKNVDHLSEIDLDCMNGKESGIEDTKPLYSALSEEESNRARFSVYPKYFKAGGLLLTLLLLILTIVSNIAQISYIWWIQKFMWLASISHSYENTTSIYSMNLTNQSIAPVWFVSMTSKEHFWTTTSLIAGSIVFLFLEWLTFIILTWRIAIKLHSKMFKSVLKISIRFFEINSSGRILNRFSKDTANVDNDLPYDFLDYWIFLFIIICPLIASCIVEKLLILQAVILIFIFFASVRYYLPTATELRSLESLMRSPLFSHISLTLQGMTTIRSLGMQAKVEEDLIYHLNAYTKVWITLQSSIAWFIQRLAFVVRLFMSVVIWTVFLKNYYYYSANGNFPFIFQILFNVPTLFYLASIQAVNVDVLMVAVERIFAYIKLKPENETESKDIGYKISKDEPQILSTSRGMLSEGSIAFENVFLKYADDLPLVLKGISFKIMGGSKVGIVGRTGAGKSSIINALFRLTNLSEGRILIDGVDISYLKLNRLRTQIAVIPQDPMLFIGTLRFNLDPFDQFSDSEIWSSLEHVQLRELVASLQGGLLVDVQEDGTNFSVGEKQLLCLARALLKNTRILVVDEATANVDHRTDAKIQNTLRASFSNQTVISIAHRLNTVIDYDRIVVIDKGEIIEMDSPYFLLQDTQSYPSKLVSQTDPITQIGLRKSARSAYRETSL